MKQLNSAGQSTLGKVYFEDSSSLLRLERLLEKLKSRYNVGADHIADLLKDPVKHLEVPVGIFALPLSPLEALVSYLYYYKGLSQTVIAELLKRDHTTIWTTLSKAEKKCSKTQFLESLQSLDKEVKVPFTLFQTRSLSILESLASHLKKTMTYHQIALLIGKNDRTIWTVVKRAHEKLKK